MEIWYFIQANFSKEDATSVSIGAVAMLIMAMILYITRIKDHMREEKKIDDYHFSKVKEIISDSIEYLEESIMQRGIQLIEKSVADPLEICSSITGINCKFMQSERFENDVSKAIERLKGKVIGWMRENGFHESDDHGVEKYVQMRLKHTMDFLPVYIEKKARSRFPSVSNNVESLIDKKEIEEFLSDIVEFSIEEMKIANKAIKEYRFSHGFTPEFVLKTITAIKGNK